MDPIWAAATELWWAAPAAAGVGAGGFATVRMRQTMTGRRLGLDAARWELRQALREARSSAIALRVARAELASANAERAASRGSAEAVAAAKRTLREAQLTSKTATARVRAVRARISAERAALGSRDHHPLTQVRTRHDAVLARWMAYETDPALALAFPQMSDGRQPRTAACLAVLVQARDLRPAEGESRISPEGFSAYRNAVDALEQSFDAAERAVRGERSPQELPEALRDAARTIADGSAEVIERTVDLLQSLTARLGRRN